MFFVLSNLLEFRQRWYGMVKFIWILAGAMGALVKGLSNKEKLRFFRKDQL